MGFFSSIGKVFKSVAKPVIGGVIGGALGLPFGLAGAGAAIGAGLGSSASSQDAADAQSDWYKSAYGDQMAFAREQFDFNKQYIQNQLQWRVDDAKKAGLHPMAVLGLNGASFSPVSSPSIPSLPQSTYDPSELGQSVAYAATKAKTNRQQEQAFELAQMTGQEQLRGVQLDNELKQLEIMSLASRLTQTGPAAPDLNGGRNLLSGQNDSPSPAFQKFVLPDGTVTGWYPSDEYQQIHEDIPVLEFMPHARANWWHLKDWMKKKDTHKGYYLPRSWR